jgi:predicted permease
VTFTADPTLRGYTPEQSRALSNALLQKARALPGVARASIASRPVMRGTGLKGTLAVAGTQIKATDFLNSSLNSITPGYFETMGIHVLAGRDFNWFDRNRMPPHKAIVNQTFARRFFPGRNPIGERIGSPGPNGVARADDAIIGVVSDAKYRSLREPVPPTVYGPVVDGFESGFILYVRTYQRPAAMTAPIREVLRSLDPGLPFIEIQTLQDEVEASLWQERLLAWLSSMFGAIATLLASIGLYGALDYALKVRTREIGVRMALGAQPARIVGLFSADTLVLIATGIVVGLCIYSAAAIGLRRVVYDVHTWEPAVVALVVLIVGLVAVMAAGPVAYRAVRIDPASALRAE